MFNHRHTRRKPSGLKNKKKKTQKSNFSWLLPEVAPKVGHNVVVLAFFHHEDFLLNYGKIISWRQRKETDVNENSTKRKYLKLRNKWN